MQHGLIDEFRLLTFPVVLGKGKRLFADGARPVAMEHEHQGTNAGSVSIDVYTPTGEPTFGAAAQSTKRDAVSISDSTRVHKVALIGSRPRIVVPSPGADSTSTSPPWAERRSEMPWSPVP